MASVTIMLGAFNGQDYIGEQLDSIIGQRHSGWKLIVSDDGSTDLTPKIVKGYMSRLPTDKISLRQGPKLGFCKNFLSMACDPSLSSDYYAFSDQDDLWEPNKLSSALSWLATIPMDTPAIYCSRSALIDNDGKYLGLSAQCRVSPNFRNALVQSIGGGNTMVFNAAARKLLLEVGADVDVASHDWWLYILVSGVGGKVKHDATPMIKYRQHHGNLVGSNLGVKARLSRMLQLLRGDLKGWNDMHLSALVNVKHLFLIENQRILDEFTYLRRASLFARIGLFLRLGLKRQSPIDQFGLLLAVALGKF